MESKFNSKIINYGIFQISPQLELKRQIIINEIKNEIKKELNEKNFNKIDVNNFFPKWLMYQLNFSEYNLDPVIPYKNINNISLMRDFYFLSEKKLSTIEIKKKIKNLNLEIKCKEAIDELNNYISSDDYIKFVNKYKINIEEDNLYEYFYFTPSKKLFPNITEKIKYKISRKVTEKCLKKYIFKQRDNKFNILILSIILRYNTLQSYNQQLAIYPPFLEYLQKNLNVECELFASALNHFFPNYFSLYYDLEMYFGSKGNIFQTVLNEGIYWANPPYDEQIIKLFVEKIISDFNSNKPITILLNIPVWDKKDYNGFEALEILRNSNYITKEFIIPKKKAKYYDYYLDKIIYPANVYIIIVQNNAAKKEHLIENNIHYAINHYFIQQ